MYLRSFSVQGYRSFRERLTLDRLGPAVVFFGTNNAGKSNLVKALELFHRLMKLDVARLLDTAPRNADAFYSELGQDPWMFHVPGDDIVELRGEVAPAEDADSVSIGFRIARSGESITTELIEWGSADAGMPLARARDARLAMIEAQDLADQQDAQDAVSSAERLWAEANEKWASAIASHGPGMSIHLAAGDGPGGRELRNRFSRLSKSVDLKRRKRAAWAMERFAAVVPGLPEGRIEPIESPSAGTDESADTGDFGWVSQDAVLPIDRLGSGAQSVFGVLAALALADTRVMALEEPEYSLNAGVQQLLAEVIVGSVGADAAIEQLFIATHSPAFARPDCDLRLLDRRPGGTVAVHAPATTIRELTGFSPVPGGGGVERTASLLDYDGSIRLPKFVLDELESSKGHFVYFVRAASGGFRMVPSAEMGELLGEDAP